MNLYPVDLPPLLAIETSTAVCAVAALVRGESFEDTRYLERAHNQHALGMIDAVTASVRDRFGSEFAGFRLVAFGRGPGSFTGVRIGAALAQGIAFAQDAQVLPVGSLQVQAQALLGSGAASEVSSLASSCVVLVKSRQQQFYAQAFNRTAVVADPNQQASLDSWQCLAEPSLVGDLDQWRSWLTTMDMGNRFSPRERKASVVLGELPQWLRNDDAAECFVPDVGITAASVLRVAVVAALGGQALAPELGLPEYLAADSPWQPSA